MTNKQNLGLLCLVRSALKNLQPDCSRGLCDQYQEQLGLNIFKEAGLYLSSCMLTWEHPLASGQRYYPIFAPGTKMYNTPRDQFLYVNKMVNPKPYLSEHWPRWVERYMMARKDLHEHILEQMETDINVLRGVAITDPHGSMVLPTKKGS